MEIEQLWDLMDARIVRLPPLDLPLADAVGCVIAQDVLSPADLPPFNYSAMDGYALGAVEPGPYTIVARIAAGDETSRRLKAGEAARILTGGKIPEGAFCVARQEDCVVEGDQVRLHEGCVLAAGDHIRLQGGVCRAGTTLLGMGSVCTAGAVALLASSGISFVRVVPRPSALHIATGSELVEPGASLAGGKIYDSNGPMIGALLRDAGVCPARCRLDDSPDALERVVGDFRGDLLLVSGGSGPGDHDHTARALEEAGYVIHASGINSRPGKPLIFATRGQQAAFGLPGNPLSHWVCYQAFVTRALARMCGRIPPEWVMAYSVGPVAGGGDGRRTWTPARRGYEGGSIVVHPLPWKHSGDLTPLTHANALILGFPEPASRLVKTLLL